MMHKERQFGIVTVGSVDQLVDDLKEHSWTLCTGFQLEDLLFLNDAFGEDGAQEYAVFRGTQQIESLTVSWMSRAELDNEIRYLVGGGGCDGLPHVTVQVEPIENHTSCRLCA